MSTRWQSRHDTDQTSPIDEHEKEKSRMTPTRRKLTLAIASIGGVAGIALMTTGAATATPTTPTPTPVVSVAPIPPTPIAAPTATPPEPAVASETPEPAATPAEAAAEAALPGGGHADPAGANVDHQFEGVE
jgi:hypothetical protein